MNHFLIGNKENVMKTSLLKYELNLFYGAWLTFGLLHSMASRQTEALFLLAELQMHFLFRKKA